MKKNSIVRLVCLLLALLTLCVSVASCKKDNNPSQNTDDKTQEPSSDNGTGNDIPVDYRELLPTGDYGNEDCWIFMPNLTEGDFYVDEKEENPTEYQQAIAVRNRKVEDRLNVALMYKVEPTHDISQYVKVCLNANTYNYDIMYSFSWFGLEAQGAFENLYNYSNIINFENPYWVSSLNQMATINNRLYGAYGYLTMSMVSSEQVIFYNGNIAKNVFEVDDQFYADVENKNWTLETMMDYMKMNSLQSGDGNPEWTFEDSYGLGYNLWSGRALLWGAGLKLAEYADGDANILTRRPKNSDIFDKVYSFLQDNDCSWYKGNDNNGYSVDWDTDYNLFIQELALFEATTIGFAPRFSKEMKNYGVLPMPMLDKTQEDYITPMQGVNNFSLFKAGTNNEKAAKVLEAMTIYSYCDVLPLYYEKQLKLQYQTDRRAGAMLDFIRSKVNVDFMFMHSAHFESLANVPFELILAKDSNYEGDMAGRTDSLNKAKAKFLEIYTKAE